MIRSTYEKDLKELLKEWLEWEESFSLFDPERPPQSLVTDTKLLVIEKEP